MYLSSTENKEKGVSLLSQVKRYVKVICSHEADGRRVPMRLYLDGTRYDIESVKHVTPMHELERGRKGLRYTIQVNGHETHLFEERERFFVLKKEKEGV